MISDAAVRKWWDSLDWKTKEGLVGCWHWVNMSAEEREQVRYQHRLMRAGVEPLVDVDSGNLLEVITKLQTRIDYALENITDYIPEFILEGDAHGDTQVRPDPNRKYHPESSVNSFKDDLKNILEGRRQ